LSIQLLKVMIVLSALMKSKKLLFLLPVGLALILCTSVLVASVSPTAFGQQPNTGGNQNMTTATTTNNTTTSTAGTLDCQMAASTLRGQVIPNPTGVCDVAVPLQGLQVQDTATGATLNNLLVINPLFEFTQVSSQAADGGTTGGNQTMVYGFAEIGSMEGQLPLAIRMLSNSSWNVIAVHNHVIGESPRMMFAHAIANGDINTLVREARAVLDSLMTQMQSQSGNQTSTTASGGGGNATTTGGGTTGGNMTSEPMNSSPSANSLTGGTTTGEGATAGDGVGTFGGGGGTSPGPGVGTTEGGQQEGGTTTGNGGAEDGTTGGAAGPQVRP
jgi:hypothetical protein